MENEIAEVVREHGWYAADVRDADPPFIYSIGLMQSFDHPELIAFGLESKVLYAILNKMVGLIRQGASFAEPGAYPDVLVHDKKIGIRRVHPTQHPLYLGYAMGYCTYLGRVGELHVVQVFWPDEQGKFPFDAGCDLDAYCCQPRLDIPLTVSEIAEFERKFGSPE